MTISDTARLHADTLAVHIHTHLPNCRPAALRRLAAVLLALIQAESTLHRKIVLHLPRKATLERATVRVLHDLHLTPQEGIAVLPPLITHGKFTLISDRTTWHNS